MGVAEVPLSYTARHVYEFSGSGACPRDVAKVDPAFSGTDAKAETQRHYDP
jgi:hypothetical protein